MPTLSLLLPAFPDTGVCRRVLCSHPRASWLPAAAAVEPHLLSSPLPAALRQATLPSLVKAVGTQGAGIRAQRRPQPTEPFCSSANTSSTCRPGELWRFLGGKAEMGLWSQSRLLVQENMSSPVREGRQVGKSPEPRPSAFSLGPCLGLTLGGPGLSNVPLLKEPLLSLPIPPPKPSTHLSPLRAKSRSQALLGPQSPAESHRCLDDDPSPRGPAWSRRWFTWPGLASPLPASL